jgi:hypothetical protein
MRSLRGEPSTLGLSQTLGGLHIQRLACLVSCRHHLWDSKRSVRHLNCAFSQSSIEAHAKRSPGHTERPLASPAHATTPFSPVTMLAYRVPPKGPSPPFGCGRAAAAGQGPEACCQTTGTLESVAGARVIAEATAHAVHGTTPKRRLARVHATAPKRWHMRCTHQAPKRWLMLRSQSCPSKPTDATHHPSLQAEKEGRRTPEGSRRGYSNGRGGERDVNTFTGDRHSERYDPKDTSKTHLFAMLTRRLPPKGPSPPFGCGRAAAAGQGPEACCQTAGTLESVRCCTRHSPK